MENPKSQCNGNLDCPAPLTHRSNCLSRYQHSKFGEWWATKKAEGYDYGYEALENVRFGFDAALAQGVNERSALLEKIGKLEAALTNLCVAVEARDSVGIWTMMLAARAALSEEKGED